MDSVLSAYHLKNALSVEQQDEKASELLKHHGKLRDEEWFEDLTRKQFSDVKRCHLLQHFTLQL